VLPSNEGNTEPIYTAEIVAKQIGVSRATYERAKKIRDEGTPQEIQEALSKLRQISHVYNKVQKRRNLEYAHAAGTPPMPDGLYDIIYADPAWRYDSEASQRGKADNHYATMTTKDICDLKVPSAENALLFSWVTNAALAPMCNQSYIFVLFSIKVKVRRRTLKRNIFGINH